MPGRCKIPGRCTIVILCFLALMLTYMMRFCIAILITQMVRMKKGPLDYACPFEGGGEEHQPRTDKDEFDWDEKTKGMIMSAFFLGYILTHLPGGLLADRLGGKYPLGGAILVSALSTLFTPLVARVGDEWGMIVLRILMGLGQGLIYPSVSALLSQWIPTEERTCLCSIVFTGAMMGNIVSMTVSGLILKATQGLWSAVFYLFGALSLVWVAAWMVWGYSSPKHHPGLSEKEKRRLKAYLKSMRPTEELASFPWKDVLTSKPVWGLIVAEIGHDWGIFTVFIELPSYMETVLHFSVLQTGLLSALPYVSMATASLLTACLVDSLLKKKLTSITTSRKIFAIVSSAGAALALVGVTLARCNKGLVNLLFTVGIGFFGIYYPSLKINCLDLSPNYAGGVMALVNGFGSVSGIISPFLAGFLIDGNTMDEWRVVFVTTAAVLVVSTIIYIFLASGEVQHWNNPPLPDQGSTAAAQEPESKPV